MGNRHSSHATKKRRHTLLREDSIFSEATWDFCEDIRSLGSIELELMSYQPKQDKTENSVESDHSERPAVPIPGMYLMSSQQYNNWCKIFGTPLRSEGCDAELSLKDLRTSRWRSWVSRWSGRRARSHSLDASSLGSSVEKADGCGTKMKWRNSAKNSPKVVKDITDTKECTDDEAEYEGACSPPANEVRSHPEPPARSRFVSVPRPRYFSSSVAEASSSDLSPTRSGPLQRRRHNSEPSSGLHDYTNVKPDPLQTYEEEDLEEELQWLTAVTDSLYSKGAASDFELSVEAMISDDEEPHEGFIGSGKSSCSCPEDVEGGSDVVVGSPAGESWEPRPYDLETELDWLCEPEWNNLELELFWHVLRPHLETLLQPQHSAYLPEPCVPVRTIDAKDSKLLDRYLLHVQWHIWKGNYSQAVSDFRAIRCHFRCGAQSQLIESDSRDDVEILRLIFQRKRPSRFRLWI